MATTLHPRPEAPESSPPSVATSISVVTEAEWTELEAVDTMSCLYDVSVPQSQSSTTGLVSEPNTPGPSIFCTSPIPPEARVPEDRRGGLDPWDTRVVPDQQDEWMELGTSTVQGSPGCPDGMDDRRPAQMSLLPPSIPRI